MRLPLEGLVVVALALVVPAAHATPPGLRRRSGSRSAGDREDPRHGVLREPSTGRSTPSPTGATPGSASRRCATRSGGRRRTCWSPARSCSASAVLVLTTLAVLRLTRVAAGHRRWSLQAVTALGVVWALCWVLGASSHAPIASTSAAGLVAREVRAVRAGVEDHAIFADADPPRPLPRHPCRPAADRPARQGRHPRVRRELREGRGPGLARSRHRSTPRSPRGPARLQAAGFCARSAFLTSSTFGGLSWLAHSTMQSGVWVDNQLRYDQLVKTDRLTLSVAFKRAGWRTVGDVPSNNRTWPEGTSFYHFDKLYDRRNVGYHGPRFSYASMPDQYVLAALQRLELAKSPRRPVFAEVDLVSSHTPWTRIPRMIDWSDVGDGSIFKHMPVDQLTRGQLFSDSHRVRAAYGQSIEYTLDALVSFVQHYGDDNLVLVVLGDHQPAKVITGENPSHDVPDLGHRPRPGGAAAGSPDGAGRTACGPARRRRSGRWTPSATASSARSARNGGERPRCAVDVPARCVRRCRRAPRGARAAETGRASTASGAWPRSSSSCITSSCARSPATPSTGRRSGPPGSSTGASRSSSSSSSRASRWPCPRRATAGGSMASPASRPGAPVASSRAYWAALVFSLAVAWLIVPPPGQGAPDAKSVVVNGLLVQNLVGAPSPDRSFWSIAVEAQLYVLFPLLLLLVRRRGAVVMVAAVTLVVATVGIVGPARPPPGRLRDPVAARPRRAVRRRHPGRRHRGREHARRSWPWAWLALAAAAPVLATIWWQGSVWTLDHLFWVDLALGPAVACLLAGLATGHPARLLRLLDTRPAAQPRLVVLQPVPDARPDRRRRVRGGRGRPRPRRAFRRSSSRSPWRAADDRVRAGLRGGLRAPVPAAPAGPPEPARASHPAESGTSSVCAPRRAFVTR